jgi:hypothetical protein
MQAQGKLSGMEKLTMTIIRTICAGILTLTLSSVATNAQLLNNGFEVAGGIYTDTANNAIITTGALNWVQFNNGLRSTTDVSNPVSTVRSGNYSLWCYGDTSWVGEGAYQQILGVSPGQQWVFGGYGLTPSTAPLTNIAGGNPPQPFGLLQMIFQGINSITTNGSAYSTNFSSLATLSPPSNFTGAITDAWQFGSVTGTAPARTVAISVYVFELGYGAGSQGSIYFDDLSLVNLNAPIVTNRFYETIGRGNQVCWLSDTNSTWQPQASVNNVNWVNLGQALQGDGNTDCVFDASLSNKFYRVLQLQ